MNYEFNETIQKIMDSKAYKKHYGEKENVYFKDCSFGSTDLIPALQLGYEEESGSGGEDHEEEEDENEESDYDSNASQLIYAAANQAVKMGKKFSQDM